MKSMMISERSIPLSNVEQGWAYVYEDCWDNVLRGCFWSCDHADREAGRGWLSEAKLALGLALVSSRNKKVCLGNKGKYLNAYTVTFYLADRGVQFDAPL